MSIETSRCLLSQGDDFSGYSGTWDPYEYIYLKYQLDEESVSDDDDDDEDDDEEEEEEEEEEDDVDIDYDAYFSGQEEFILIDHYTSDYLTMDADLYYLMGNAGLIDPTSSSFIEAESSSYDFRNTWTLYSYEGAWWAQSWTGTNNDFDLAPRTVMYKRLPDESTHFEARPEVGDTATVYYGITRATSS